MSSDIGVIGTIMLVILVFVITTIVAILVLSTRNYEHDIEQERYERYRSDIDTGNILKPYDQDKDYNE